MAHATHAKVMPKIPRASLPVLTVLALFAAGCGSSSGTSSSTTATTSTSAADAGPPHVVMQSLEFTPTTVKAKVGQRVTWTNKDSAPHNVTYVSGPAFRSSRTIKPGKKFTLKLMQAGTIQYLCTIHPWMKATIVVSP